jgi:hypothetical protein
MSTTLEIYRDLMRHAEPTDAKGARILEVVRLWHEEVLELGHYLQGCAPPIFADDLPTFEWEGADATCTVHEKWSGTIDRGGERMAIADAIANGMTTDRGGGYHALVLSDDRLVTVDLGSTAFVARMVEPAKRLRSRVRIDTPFVGVMASVGTLFLAVMALVLTSPPLPESEAIDLPDRFADVILLPPPKPVPSLATPDARHDSPKPSSATSQTATPRRKRDLDRQIAEAAGIFPALAQLEQRIGEGFAAAIGGASTLRAGGGTPGGLGWSGGPSGPGGTIDGIGDIGTHGPGYGESGGDFGPKKDGGSIRAQGDPIVIGALGKAEIDAVIKRNLSSIRYCYERQLSRAPNLAGKVSIKFVISKSGAVSRAVIDSSTVNDDALENCLQSRFLQMTFPEPKGGGIVIVNYPFLFAPG